MKGKGYLVLPLYLLLLGTLFHPFATRQHISGTVTDMDGVPLSTVFVVLLSAEDYGLATDPVQTDEHGRYQFEVPGRCDYLLIVVPFTGQIAGGYNLHGYGLQSALIEAGPADVIQDFALVPCHDLILEGYRPDGTLVANGDSPGVRFAEELAGTATEPFFGIRKEGLEEVPGVCIPLNQTRRPFVQWTVPDFGSIVLAADNGEAGYMAAEQGGTVLNLNYELARTQVGRLQANLSKYQAAGYGIPPAFTTDLVEAETLLAQAAAGTGAGQAALSDQVIDLALWTLEELEQIRAAQEIPRQRRGTLTVTVLDPAGDPLPGATVAYTQVSHDFLFGIFDTLQNAGAQSYERMQQAELNYLTTGFYWNETEPQQDQLAWDHMDHEIGVLDLFQMGFGLKAHALMAWWDFATPDYLKTMSFDDLNQEVYEHITTLVNRYQRQIDIWNVINEAHGRSAALDFSRTEITTLTQTGIQAIRAHDPDARIIVNNSFDWYAESSILMPFLKGTADDLSLPVPAYLDQLAASAVDYDIIGQQLYNGGYVDIFARWGLGDPSGVPTWDLAHISALLDRLGEYGKPVHVTEQSVPSTWDPGWTSYGTGWWHRPWDEETQAEFVHDFYTLVFSKERVEAITWWNITDRNSFIVGGGLLDADGNPKQAYFTLRDLIAGWTTTDQGETDAAGQITIQGYAGEYALTITHNGQIWPRTVHVEEQHNGLQTVHLGDTWIYLPLVGWGS